MNSTIKLFMLIYVGIMVCSFSENKLTVNGNLPEQVIKSFESGNVQELSPYLNTTVEMNIIGKEGLYSKQQALMIIKDFFAKYPPQDFTVLFEGGKTGSQYVIAKFVSKSDSFRINFLIKNQIIHQLRIETSDE